MLHRQIRDQRPERELVELAAEALVDVKDCLGPWNGPRKTGPPPRSRGARGLRRPLGIAGGVGEGGRPHSSPPHGLSPRGRSAHLWLPRRSPSGDMQRVRSSVRSAVDRVLERLFLSAPAQAGRATRRSRHAKHESALDKAERRGIGTEEPKRFRRGRLLASSPHHQRELPGARQAGRRRGCRPGEPPWSAESAPQSAEAFMLALMEG